MPCSHTLQTFVLLATWQLVNTARKATIVETESSVHAGVPPHVKARRNHPDYEKGRFQVPDEKVQFRIPWPQYKPVEYTHSKILAGPTYADPVDLKLAPFTDKEHKSYHTIKRGILAPESDGKRFTILTQRVFNPKTKKHEVRPQNPSGRTGMTGRGTLGKWGANQAADPIVVRCKNGHLQVALIVRGDGTREWAIPGGMNDPGELVSRTAIREFEEEAAGAEKDLVRQAFGDVSKRVPIYTGYVDDPRNTDNAWMETAVFIFRNDDFFNQFNLTPGDDANKAHWVEFAKVFTPGALRPGIYASHLDFLKLAYTKLGGSPQCTPGESLPMHM